MSQLSLHFRQTGEDILEYVKSCPEFHSLDIFREADPRRLKISYKITCDDRSWVYEIADKIADNGSTELSNEVKRFVEGINMYAHAIRETARTSTIEYKESLKEPIMGIDLEDNDESEYTEKEPPMFDFELEG